MAIETIQKSGAISLSDVKALKLKEQDTLFE